MNLEWGGGTSAESEKTKAQPAYQLIRVVAADPSALMRRCGETASAIEAGSPVPRQIMGSGEFRAAFVATSADQACQMLSSYSPDTNPRGGRPTPPRPKIAFLFSGLDSTGIGRCHELLRDRPLFQELLARADKVMASHLTSKLSAFFDCQDSSGQLFRRSLSEPASGQSEPRPALAHAALITIECALAQMWTEFGIEPDLVAGYSLGEYSAACVAGAFTFETILSIVVQRALTLERLPKTGMLAVAAGYGQISDIAGPELHLVAANSPDETILGGTPSDLARMREDLRSRGYATDLLPGDHAFHTPYMQPIASTIEELFAGQPIHPLAKPMVSTLTGDLIAAPALAGSHWALHLTSPVRFSEALDTLARLDTDIFLEVGPGQALSSIVHMRHASQPQAEVGSTMPSAFDRRPAIEHVLRTAARLWTAGAPLKDPLPLPLARSEDVDHPSGLDADLAGAGGEVSMVRQICAETLNVGEIAADQNLFDFGANSLTFARIALRISEKLGRQVAVKDILARPTPAEIGAFLNSGGEAEPRGDEVTFPGGLRVRYQSAAEAGYFYSSIFTERSYLRHGLSIRPGDVVVDVGANIGLFSIFCALEAPDVHLYAFEPVPELFALLERNVGEYCDDAFLFNAGLGDVSGSLPITYYPNSPGMSSFAARDEDEEAILGTIIENYGRQGSREAGIILGSKEEYLQARLMKRSFTSQVLRLSDVITEQGITSINLLKIDVQKFESKVLDGIEDCHWPMVKQIVIEVHDQNDRLRSIVDMLTSRGFRTVAEQDELYRGTDIHLVYATRAPGASAE